VIDHAKTTVLIDMKGGEARVAVEIHDSRVPGLLTLYFAHPGQRAGFLGLKVRSEKAITNQAPFAGLARRLPHYIAYARGVIEWKVGDQKRALDFLRTEGATRGLPDRFYEAIAAEYRELVAANDPHPIKTIAERRPVDKSRASRWVTEARRRGYLPKKGTDQK
jgi:hypothetical protein